MFCPNCGKPNGEGQKFCSSCGKPLVDNQPIDNGFDFHGGTDGYYFDPKKQKKEEKKRRKQQSGSNGKKKLVAIIAAAAVLLAAGGTGTYFLLSRSSGGGDAYVYLSNGSYELLRDTKGKNPVSIGSNGSSYANVTFTDNGYVYYFTQVDSSTGTLCRAKYDKIKSSGSNASDHIEVIATNVQLYENQVLSDGRVVYATSNGALYVYDGESTSTRVASDVSDLFVNENGSAIQVIFDTSYDGTGGRSCYGFSLDDLTLRQYGYGDLYLSASDVEDAVYITLYSDEGYQISLMDYSDSVTELGSGSVILSTEDGFYYEVEEAQSLSISQYLSDDYAEGDATAVEPNLDNYASPTYDYVQLRADSDVSGYSEIYTSCNQYLYFWKNSMEEIASNSSDEARRSACQAFIDKYAGQANESGYIVVTNEIAADLQSMAQNFGQQYDGEWLEFCFAYDVTDTDYDYDAYDQAVEDYEAAVSRNELRQSIQNGDYDQPLYSLYLYQDGTSTLVAEHVLSTQIGGSWSNFMIYMTADQVDPIPLDEVSYDWSFYSRFSASYTSGVNCIGQGSTTPFHLSDQVVDTIQTATEGSGMYLYLAGSDLVMWESNYALSVSTVSDNVAGAFTILSDRALFMGLDGDGGFYYMTNLESYECGDLYHWEDGTSTCLASSVLSSGIQIYEDDVILAYAEATSFGYSYYYGYELQMFQKGVGTAIADDVSSFVRVDKNTLLYISDDDLYVYDGKTSTQLDTRVDAIWSAEEMPYTALSDVYYY